MAVPVLQTLRLIRLGHMHVPSPLSPVAGRQDGGTERSPMYGYAAPSTAAVPGVVVALENQVRRLVALLDGVDGTRSRLPNGNEGVWRGSAHVVYTTALAGLARELADVRGQLDRALAGSRSALGVLASRG
jgi:hypothetical protein